MVAWMIVTAMAVAAPGDARTAVTEDRVDVIEINHYIDDRGEHLVGQVLFLDWSARDNRHNVRAWRFLSRIGDGRPVPTPDGGCLLRFDDAGVLREVRATTWRETWTRYDREVQERNYVAREQRPDLTLPFVR